MPNVDDIKSVLNVSNGPSLRSNYVVTVVPPRAFLGLGAGFGGIVGGIGRSALSLLAMKQLSMLAQNASLPGRTISTTPHRMYGTVREMPYGVLYAPITITFICTNIMVERAFFDLWQQSIVYPKSNYMNYYNDYVGRVLVQKVDNAGWAVGSVVGELISTYILEEAYPKVVQEQELAYGSKNEVMTLTVEFSYARWRSSLDYALDTFGITDPKYSGVTPGDTNIDTPDSNVGL